MNIKVFLAILCISFPSSCFPQLSAALSKEKTIELYQSLYVSSALDSLVWNGSIKKCNSGTLNKSIYLKAQDRVNFFRLVNGLQPAKVNPKFNQEAQDAALLIKANDQLTHTPSKNFKCYTQSAYNGCSKSCLGFSDYKNFPETAFITAFIADYGDGNYFVGHRKWILYSKLKDFGFGATDNTQALHVVDGTSNDSTLCPEFVAYPWNGFVPVNLIFPKWSFSIPSSNTVDFSKCTIKMTDAKGKELVLVKLQERKNFLDPTVVWTAKSLFSEYDIKYGLNKLEEKGFLNSPIKVRIKNVLVNGKIKNYEYTVTPFKP